MDASRAFIIACVWSHLGDKGAHLAAADTHEAQLRAEDERLVHRGARAVDVKLRRTAESARRARSLYRTKNADIATKKQWDAHALQCHADRHGMGACAVLAAHANLLHVGGHSAEGLGNLGVTIHIHCATREAACNITHYLIRCSSW